MSDEQNQQGGSEAGEPRPAPVATSGPGEPQSVPRTLSGIAGLQQLRDRVELAAHELKQLREQNVALQKRISELEKRERRDAAATHIALGQDPAILRRKISGFIEAIDGYLEDAARDAG